jgi:hypothetical protein
MGPGFASSLARSSGYCQNSTAIAWRLAPICASKGAAWAWNVANCRLASATSIRCESAVEEGLRELLTALGDYDVLLEDVEARLFGAHIEVVPADVGRDHHHHPIPCSLEGLDAVSLRLVCAADPAEEIEVPIHLESTRFLHAAEACAVIADRNDGATRLRVSSAPVPTPPPPVAPPTGSA